MLCLFFCVKQKTAYEVRIRDWSSDVCSSDLFGDRRRIEPRDARRRRHRRLGDRPAGIERFVESVELARLGRRQAPARGHAAFFAQHRQFAERSEEHTSELQSLMRISYAVFCLKKKKHEPNTTTRSANQQDK